MALDQFEAKAAAYGVDPEALSEAIGDQFETLMHIATKRVSEREHLARIEAKTAAKLAAESEWKQAVEDALTDGVVHGKVASSAGKSRQWADNIANALQVVK